MDPVSEILNVSGMTQPLIPAAALCYAAVSDVVGARDKIEAIKARVEQVSVPLEALKEFDRMQWNRLNTSLTKVLMIEVKACEDACKKLNHHIDPLKQAKGKLSLSDRASFAIAGPRVKSSLDRLEKCQARLQWILNVMTGYAMLSLAIPQDEIIKHQDFMTQLTRRQATEVANMEPSVDVYGEVGGVAKWEEARDKLRTECNSHDETQEMLREICAKLQEPQQIRNQSVIWGANNHGMQANNSTFHSPINFNAADRH